CENDMSWVTDRWPGFWNTVNSASNNRTMITQRAKLRKLAFIQRPSWCEAPAPSTNCLPDCPATRPTQCRCARCPCQAGRVRFDEYSASFVNALGAAPPFPASTPWAPPARRRPLHNQAIPLQRHHGARQRPAKPAGRAIEGAGERFAHGFELAEFDRPLIADLGGRPPDQPQHDFSGHIAQTSGIECDRPRRRMRAEAVERGRHHGF